MRSRSKFPTGRSVTDGWGRAVFQPGMKRPWERSFRPEQAPNETPSIERGACGKPRWNVGSGQIPRRRGTACRGSGRRRGPPPRAGHPCAPFGQERCGQSLRASPQRGRMLARGGSVSAKGLARISRSVRGGKATQEGTRRFGHRSLCQSAFAVWRFNWESMRRPRPGARASPSPLRCASLRPQAVHPSGRAVAVISRNHPSPKGAPQ